MANFYSTVDYTPRRYVDYPKQAFAAAQLEIEYSWKDYITTGNNYALSAFFCKFSELARVNLYREPEYQYTFIDLKARKDLDASLVSFMLTLKSQRNHMSHMYIMSISSCLCEILESETAAHAIEITKTSKIVNCDKLANLKELFEGEVLDMIKAKGSIKPYSPKHPDMVYEDNMLALPRAIQNYKEYGKDYPKILKDAMKKA